MSTTALWGHFKLVVHLPRYTGPTLHHQTKTPSTQTTEAIQQHRNICCGLDPMYLMVRTFLLQRASYWAPLSLVTFIDTKARFTSIHRVVVNAASGSTSVVRYEFVGCGFNSDRGWSQCSTHLTLEHVDHLPYSTPLLPLGRVKSPNDNNYKLILINLVISAFYTQVMVVGSIQASTNEFDSTWTTP